MLTVNMSTERLDLVVAAGAYIRRRRGSLDSARVEAMAALHAAGRRRTLLRVRSLRQRVGTSGRWTQPLHRRRASDIHAVGQEFSGRQRQPSEGTNSLLSASGDALPSSTSLADRRRRRRVPVLTQRYSRELPGTISWPDSRWRQWGGWPTV